LGPSVCPVGILIVTHQGAACDAASTHFGQTISRTEPTYSFAKIKTVSYITQ